MEKITLEQFTAEIETTFSNYADTNDIDHQSIKTWVIQALRKFGKNICEKSETLVEVVNKRTLLPENFKSLTFAIKVDFCQKEDKDKMQLVSEKRYIENPAIWDDITKQYIVDYCETTITTEKKFVKKEVNSVHNIQLLSLEDYISKEVLDVDCINLHPTVRNKNENRINIVNRTLNTNFSNGFVYLRYNSLPTVDGEIAIPIYTDGSIYDYCDNYVRTKIVENLIANNKNPQSLSQLYQIWKNEEKVKFVLAKSEANNKGLKPGWDRRMYRQNLINRKRIGL